MGLEVVMPSDGEWTDECGFIPIGVVRPNAVVTWQGIEMIDDGQFGPPYLLADGWHRWTGHPERPMPLDEGLNTLEFVATDENGATFTETITVTCDPAADRYQGFVSSMDLNDQGDGYVMTFVPGAVDDQPDGWGIAPTGTTTVIPVHPDAIFIVVDDSWIYSERLTAAEFAALVTFVDEGNCLGCLGDACPDGPDGFHFESGGGCIWRSGEPGGFVDIAFEILVDADGTLRQATQPVYN